MLRYNRDYKMENDNKTFYIVLGVAILIVILLFWWNSREKTYAYSPLGPIAPPLPPVYPPTGPSPSQQPPSPARAPSGPAPYSPYQSSPPAPVGCGSLTAPNGDYCVGTPYMEDDDLIQLCWNVGTDSRNAHGWYASAGNVLCDEEPCQQSMKLCENKRFCPDLASQCSLSNLKNL